MRNAENKKIFDSIPVGTVIGYDTSPYWTCKMVYFKLDFERVVRLEFYKESNKFDFNTTLYIDEEDDDFNQIDFIASLYQKTYQSRLFKKYDFHNKRIKEIVYKYYKWNTEILEKHNLSGLIWDTNKVIIMYDFGNDPTERINLDYNVYLEKKKRKRIRIRRNISRKGLED